MKKIVRANFEKKCLLTVTSLKGLGSPPYTFFYTFLFRFILKNIFKHQKFIHETFYILIFTIKRNLTLYKESSKPWNLQNSLKSKILIFWPKMTKCQTNLVRRKIFHRFFGLFSTQNHSNRRKNLKIFHCFENFDPIWSKGPKNIFLIFSRPEHEKWWVIW